MLKMWLYLAPDLKKFNDHEKDRVLKGAKKTSFTTKETYVMLGWVLVVFFLTQAVLRGAPAGKELVFTIVTNLIFTAPVMLAVVIPIHVRRVRRGLRQALQERGRG
jgi:hypothetical protein